MRGHLTGDRHYQARGDTLVVRREMDGLFCLLGTEVVNRYYISEGTYIGRGSPFGNPFTHLPVRETAALYQCATREESISKFEDWVFTQPDILSRVDELAGNRLVCFCRPRPCHGSTYLRLIAAYATIRASGEEPDWLTPNGIAKIRTHYDNIKKEFG